MQFRTLIILLIALVIIVPVASYGAFHYVQPKLTVVKNGDNVTLWYYGYIVIDGNPMVFDTNIASIADNNTTYPKAPDFHYHPPFTVLNDTVGSGSMIRGFDQGIVGMAKGQSSTIAIPPALGYGLENASKIHKYSLNGTVPTYQVLNYSTFKSEYGVFPNAGETVKSPTYGWPVSVLSFNSWYVEIENKPTPGGQYYPYNNTQFSVITEKIAGSGNNSTISYHTNAVNGTMLNSSSYVSGVSGNYYFINDNSYLVGKTLYFYVTIVSVKS